MFIPSTSQRTALTVREPARLLRPTRGVVLLVALLAAGCASGAKATTTTTTASAVTTSTIAPVTTTAPLSTGTASGDAAVQKQLENTATAELVLFTDSMMFTADTATLRSVDPSVTYGAGLTPPSSPTTVNVAVSPDAKWACLIGRSASGNVFVLVVGPNNDVYAGDRLLTACTDTSAQGLHRITG